MSDIQTYDRMFDRTEMLLGRPALDKLAAARVAVFGLGGVGGYVVEGLVRSGVGALDLIDHDRIDVTNLNRQIIATRKTVGEYKADAFARRIAEINPDCRVTVHRTFYLPGTRAQFDFRTYDYVVDAIDTVAGKLGLIEEAKATGTPIISAMGTGNKLDASAFRVADIYDTSVCPLARVIRRECRKRGIDHLKVVYSTEEPCRADGAAPADAADAPTADAPTADATAADARGGGKKRPPASIAFAPAAAGLIIAGEVVQDLIGRRRDD